MSHKFSAQRFLGKVNNGDVERLLKSGKMNPNKFIDRKNGFMMLHFAAYEGCTEIVRLLVCHGANIDAQSRDRLTPLMGAVFKNHVDVVRVLCELKADLNIYDDMGRVALSIAIDLKHFQCAREIIAVGANVNISIGLNDPDPLLLSFIGFKDEEAVEFLLQHGASVRVRNARGVSPLIRAISMSLVRIVKLLCNRRDIDTNEMTTDGETAVFFAARISTAEIVDVLCQHGAALNAPQQSGIYMPLHYACWHHNVGMAKCLLRNGADANLCMPHTGAPLDAVMATMLDEQTQQHVRPDAVAVASIARELILCGAEINIKSPIRRIPLTIRATALLSDDTVLLLLAAGADINAQADDNGETLLHYAADIGYFDLATMCIAAGADISIRDFDEDTALEKFNAKGHSNRDVNWHFAFKCMLSGAPLLIQTVDSCRIVDPIVELRNKLDSTRALLQTERRPRCLLLLAPCTVCHEATSTCCTACRCTFYCSKECQNDDWKVHKAFCKKSCGRSSKTN